MAKKYRVKRYYGNKGNYYRAKPHPLTILTVVLVFAALGYVGTIIYRPVYDFVMNIGKPQEIVYSEPEESEASEQSRQNEENEPEPESEHEKLRAVYIPFETVADTQRLDSFLTQLSGTRINAVMVDIKNAAGDVLFRTENDMADKWGVIVPNAFDLKEFSAKLESENLKLIVRMSAFRDSKAASAGRLEYAINYQNTNYLWLDDSAENGGKPWLNPYSQPARDYIESFALEAADAGAKLLVLDDVRFPDNSGVYASFGPDAASMGNRSDMLKAFVAETAERAGEKGMRTAVYYPVTEETLEQEQSDRYGGSPLLIPGKYLVLGTQPSQFAGDYTADSLEIKNPLQDPAGAVKASINYTERKISPDTEVIPMMQGGNDAPFNNAQSYTAAQVEAQIAAAASLGLREYILYNADGAYLLR